MKTLTVITTTYNRGYCIHQVYESLLRQTSNDFIWLVVDDGSDDNTKDLVNKWISEGRIVIEYYYKPNGGMHTARNLAYEKVHTEINVIIDSDDWMTDNAVELIVDFWKNNKNERYAGIVSNNISPNGELIGSPLPVKIKDSTFSDLVDLYKVKGDKKLVYRSDLTRLFPYPEIEGEKFFPASYKFRMLDQNYTLLIMHDYTCVVNYGDDSMSFHKKQQYVSCCKSFAYFRNEMMRISRSPKVIISNCIHYIAESKFAKNNHYLRESQRKFYTIVCFPIGIMYYYYLLNQVRGTKHV